VRDHLLDASHVLSANQFAGDDQRVPTSPRASTTAAPAKPSAPAGKEKPNALATSCCWPASGLPIGGLPASRSSYLVKRPCRGGVEGHRSELLTAVRVARAHSGPGAARPAVEPDDLQVAVRLVDRARDLQLPPPDPEQPLDAPPPPPRPSSRQSSRPNPAAAPRKRLFRR